MAVVAGAVAGVAASSAATKGILLATGGFFSASAGTIIGGSALLSTIGGAVVGTVVSGLTTQALADPPEVSSIGDVGSVEKGILLNKSSNNAPIPFVYGRRKVGGTRVFYEKSGSSNEYLHIVLSVVEGEIDSFENIYIDDIISTDSRFNNILDIYPHVGTDDQVADTNLVNALDAWTNDHRLQGTAYLYLRLKYNQDAYPRGLPTITSDVKGLKVYDPRTSSTTWSDNPALCIRDYLTNTRYGRGFLTSEIDDDSIIAAANYCDEIINIGGVDKKRYTCNGVIDPSNDPLDIVKRLLTSCRGFLVSTGGKYKLIIDKPETAVFTFNEDNIVGAWSIKLGDKNSQFNRISANFYNSERQWQPDIAIADSSALRTQDNSLLLEKSIELPFTSDIDRAKMITTVNINQSRQQIVSEFTATIDALRCEVGDIVYVSHHTPGWHALNNSLGKMFRVMRLTLQNNNEVRVYAMEYDVNSFDYGTIHASDTSPNTSLPSADVTSPPLNLTVNEELYFTNTSQGTQVRAILQWNQPTDAFISSYDIEYQNGTNGWEFVTTTKSLSTHVDNLKAGDYYFRVRSVNINNVRSEWVESTKIVFVGLSTPPNQIQNFTIRAIDGSCHLQWDKATDIDVLHGGFIRVRHTPLISGATWEHGTNIGEALAGTATNVVLPLLAGTYLVKAVDSAGNFSKDSTLASTTVPNILAFNTVATAAEHPTFAGQKEDTTKSGLVLRLDGAANFILATEPCIPDLITEDNDIVITEDNNIIILDAVCNIGILTEDGEYLETETAQSGIVDSYGEYYFNNSIDLGEVYTSRVTSNLVASGYVVGDEIDNRAENIDTWANFDGEPSDAVSVQLQIRTTKDDPASATWGEWSQLVIGDYHARAFEFRVIFNSSDTSRNIDVSKLAITVDMPDRNERQQNVTIPVNGTTITYTNAFKDTPTIGYTIQNQSQGDWVSLTSESSTGFTIEILNGATSVSRNINWIATGYGQAE